MKLSILTIVAAASTCVAFGQLSRGSISGTIQDPSGAFAEGVNVKVTDQATNVPHTANSNEAGIYRVVGLEPGIYTVEFSKQGFQSARVENIAVGTAQEIQVNHSLALEQATVSIVVDATPSGVTLSKASPTIERRLGQDTMEKLPLIGLRDITNFMALAPTVIRNPLADLNYSAAGQRWAYTAFLADGADNKSYSQLPSMWKPIPEGIAEFQVQTNAYSAEFGRSSGAVVSVISRSGTNQLHASLWDYYGSNWLSARTLADKQAGLSGVRFQEHQAGASLAGPIVKDRTFFFALFQATPERLGPSGRLSPPITIPTPSGYAALSRVPLAPGQTPENRQAVLSTLNFLPLAYPQAGLFEMVRPLTINGVPVEVGSTRIPTPNATLTLTSQGRLDHRLTEKDSLTVRFRSMEVTGNVGARSGAGWSNYNFGSLFASDYNIGNSALLVSHTRIFAPRLFTEFRFSYTPRHGGGTPLREPGHLVSVGGFTAGALNIAPLRNRSKQFEWQDVLTFQHGRHLLKAGADISRLPEYQFQENGTRGTWTFANLEDLLNNRALSFSQSFRPLEVSFAQTQQSYFVQDDFKASRDLTLNLGVRYQTASPAYAPFGATTPELLAAGALGPPRRDTNDWAPRFGFAWSPATDKGWAGRLLGKGVTVIRGGYGIGYMQLYGSSAGVAVVTNNYPLNSTYQKILPETINLYPTIPAKPPSIPPLNPRAEVFTHLSPDMQNPTAHFYSLSVQRQLGSSYFVELGYTGNRTYHLQRTRERNPAILTREQAQTVISTANPAGIPTVQARRLNPDWNSRTALEYDANSYFNAGYIRFDRRMARGLLVGVNYTFSATLDDSDSAGRPQDQFDYRREYARAFIDRPHRLSLHYVWTVPVFRAGASAWKRALGGWQIAGFSEWQSGEPFTITTGVDSNGDGVLYDRPDYNPGGLLSLDPVTGNWRTFKTPLDGTGIFRTPRTSTGASLPFSMPFGGNLGRYTFRGPGYGATNVSLLKTYAVTERWKLELRASWTNFLNQRNFGPPVAVMSSPQFGTNTTNPDSRATLLGLKIRF